MYKGETPSKKIVREMMWRQHALLLGDDLLESPNVFLASRVAGDVDTLRGLGVPVEHIWAVEKDRDESTHLLQRRGIEGWKLFQQKVETVMEQRAATMRFRSTVLDFCGTIEGAARTIQRIVACLPTHSVLSVTLFLGREQDKPEDREVALLQLLRKHSKHPVTVVQSVLYTSSHYDGSKSSPMGTWTFYIGPLVARPRMDFDLRTLPSPEVKKLSASPDAIIVLWRSRLPLIHDSNIKKETNMKTKNEKPTIPSGIQSRGLKPTAKGAPAPKPRGMAALSPRRRSIVARKAALTRKLRARARKAVETRRRNAHASI